jgi:glucose-6-phosphate 1-dehydrogenase
MEAPISCTADAIRDAKANVLKQIAPIRPENIIVGQYVRGKIDGNTIAGYQEEPGIPSNSQTETFATLKIELPNKRWKGVPFYLKTGKRMSKKLTEIRINYHSASESIFQSYEPACQVVSNVLTITLQSDEGFDLQFQVKTIGQPITLSSQRLRFCYSDVFGPLPDAYEILLIDAVLGDQTRAPSASMIPC